MTEFYVKVVPDQDEFRIDTTGTFPTVHLTAPAAQGRANSELLSRLKNVLRTDIGIVSGHHSRRKKLVADLQKDEITKRLAEAGEQ